MCTVAAEVIRGWGFVVTPEQIDGLAASVGEQSLLGRTGGAPSLAVGMAHIFSSAFGQGLMALVVPLRHHVRGAVHPDYGRYRNPGRPVHAPGARRPDLAPAGADLMVPEHGAGLRPGGGRLGVFPGAGSAGSRSAASTRCGRLFGISNQLLASVALCVGTTLIIKSGKARYAWVTLLPLTWLLAATLDRGMAEGVCGRPSSRISRPRGPDRGTGGERGRWTPHAAPASSSTTGWMPC